MKLTFIALSIVTLSSSLMAAELQLKGGETKTLTELQNAGVEAVSCEAKQLPPCRMYKNGALYFVYSGNNFVSSTEDLDTALGTVSKLKAIGLCQ